MGFVLANDRLGLAAAQQVRGAHGPDAGVADVRLRHQPEVSPASIEFKVAREGVAGCDSLNAFLAAYRQIYPVDKTITPDCAPARQSAV